MIPNFQFLSWCLCLMTFSTTAFSQNAACMHLLQDAAYQYKANEEYKEAIALYEETWSFFEIHRVKTCLSMVECYAALDETESLKIYFVKSIELGGTLEDYQERKLDSLIGEPTWSELELLYEPARKEHLYQFDFDMYDDLSRLFFPDQYVRRYLRSSTSMYDTLYNEVLGQVDEVNFEKFKEIVAERGVPTSKEVGEDGMKMLWGLLLHFGGLEKEEDWNYVNDLLLREVERGNFDPTAYATTVDRREFGFNGVGIYGYVAFRKGVVPVNEVEFLDERRYSIGLFSLKRQLELFENTTELLPNYVHKELDVKAIRERCK